MKPKKVWVNGKIQSAHKPALSVFDRGFLYGDGVYETIRVYSGTLFHFPSHFRRLKNSARGIGIGLPASLARMRRAALQLIKANGLKEATLRITLTRGPGPLGFDPRPCHRTTLVMISAPANHHPEKCYTKGISLALARVRRNPREALDPALKSTNNLNNILAKMEANQRRAYEALMLNVDGYLAEGTISNIFFISGGKLKTPSLDCGLLEGVTRSLVMRLTKKLGMLVVQGHFRPRDLFTAQEVFITSTTLEVMPVTRLVDPIGRIRLIGGGRVGPWARRLRSEYKRCVAAEILVPGKQTTRNAERFAQETVIIK